MILTWYRDKPKGWTLYSGLWSPLYIQLRELSSEPSLLRAVAECLSALLEDLQGVLQEGSVATKNKNSLKNMQLLGIPMAGIPIATAISLQTGIPSAFFRKIEGNRKNFETLIQSYGQHSILEGRIGQDSKIILVDDLVSNFQSKIPYLKVLEHERVKRKIYACLVQNLLVVIDREQGADAMAQEYGIKIHSLIPFRSKGIDWLKESLSSVEYQVLSEYLRSPKEFQSAKKQKELEDIAITKS